MEEHPLGRSNEDHLKWAHFLLSHFFNLDCFIEAIGGRLNRPFGIDNDDADAESQSLSSFL